MISYTGEVKCKSWLEWNLNWHLRTPVRRSTYRAHRDFWLDSSATRIVVDRTPGGDSLKSTLTDDSVRNHVWNFLFMFL